SPRGECGSGSPKARTTRGSPSARTHTIAARARSFSPARSGRRRRRADVVPSGDGKEAAAAAVARARCAGEEEDEGARLQDGRPVADLRAVRGVRGGDLDAQGGPGGGRPRDWRWNVFRRRAGREGAVPGAHRGGGFR